MVPMFIIDLPKEMASPGKYKQVIVELRCFLLVYQATEEWWLGEAWQEPCGYVPHGVTDEAHLHSVICAPLKTHLNAVTLVTGLTLASLSMTAIPQT